MWCRTELDHVPQSGFERLDIPNIPTGSLDRIKVKVVSNPRSAVEEVVQNRADNFDPSTPLPLVMLPRFRAIAEDRPSRSRSPRRSTSS